MENKKTEKKTISRYGPEWDKIVKNNKILTFNVPEPTAYWAYQILTTFRECNYEKLSKNDKKYTGEFIRILRAKLKLRHIHK